MKKEPLEFKKSCVLIFTAFMIGGVVGTLAVGLSLLADASMRYFSGNQQLIYLLPLAGIAIWCFYRATHLNYEISTSDVIEAARESKPVSIMLAPAITLGMSLTLVCGGSVGRTAAAMQLGGSISSWLGSHIGFEDDEYQRTYLMCGMTAALSVMLFAPLAAVIFIIEVMHRRLHYPRRIVLLVISALTAYAMAKIADVHIVSPSVASALDLSVIPFSSIALIGIAGAVVAGLFCVILRTARKYASRARCNLFLSILGGMFILLLVETTGMYEYSGTGIVQIDAALAGETLNDYAFLLKALFTIVALSFGFKGGEIMPILCIGACMGATLSGYLDLNQSCVVALGMIALFSGCTNCPIASVFLGIELFGLSAAPECLIVALFAFLFSYRCSLYQSARIEWTPRGMFYACLEIIYEKLHPRKAARRSIVKGGVDLVLKSSNSRNDSNNLD